MRQALIFPIKLAGRYFTFPKSFGSVVGSCGCKKQELHTSNNKTSNFLYFQTLQSTGFSTCQAMMSDHLERTSQNTRESGTHSCEVTDVKDLSQTVKEVIFTPEENPSPFTFKAGQWVDLFIPGVDTVGGFSITSSPQKLVSQRKLNLAVKYSTHPPAFWIHNSCKIGDKLTLRIGGDFHLLPAEEEFMRTKRRILLIAGGVGINPISSIIQYIANAKADGSCHANTKVRLLYSAKTEDELIFKNAFDEFHVTDTTFFPSYFVTAAAAALNNPSVVNDDCTSNLVLHQRRICMGDIRSAVHWITENDTEKNASGIESYICGPPSMIQSLTSDLHSLNVKKVFYEKWW